VNRGEDTFTEQGLGAILREIFVIGSESESVMLRWALRILSCHPTVQEAVQAELDKVRRYSGGQYVLPAPPPPPVSPTAPIEE
jgi:cytochrome P450